MGVPSGCQKDVHIERTPPTGIARNVMFGACVADRQLASTTPAADKAGEQSVAVLRRSMMPACGHVVAHHLADRLRPLPADVTLMDAWDQRQPFGSRLSRFAGKSGAQFRAGGLPIRDRLPHEPMVRRSIRTARPRAIRCMPSTSFACPFATIEGSIHVLQPEIPRGRPPRDQGQ